MKKYLSILAVTALAASAFAQGTVGFNNTSTTLVKQWTDAQNQTLVNVAKGNGSVQFYYAPQGTAYTPWVGDGTMTPAAFFSANSLWTKGSITGIAPVAGRFNGDVLALNSIPAGTSVDFVIIGWNGTASSFDAAFTAGSMVGVSSKFSMATGGVDPLIPAPSISTVFTGMTIQPVTVVPEPSTFALAGLGAAALLIFRRRN